MFEILVHLPYFKLKSNLIYFEVDRSKVFTLCGQYMYIVVQIEGGLYYIIFNLEINLFCIFYQSICS